MINDVKKIKRNILKFHGVDLPDAILDTAKNIRIEDGKIKFNVKMKVNTSGWRGCYGSSK